MTHFDFGNCTLKSNVQLSYRDKSFPLYKWRDSRIKYNIPYNIEELLEKNCEVEKLMNFLKCIGLSEACRGVIERKYKEKWLRITAIKPAASNSLFRQI